MDSIRERTSAPRAIYAPTLEVAQLAHGVKDKPQPLLTTHPTTLGEIANRLRTSKYLAKQTATLRKALQEHGRDGPYKDLKTELPAFIPAACAPVNVEVTDIRKNAHRYLNGAYGFDIDKGRETMDVEAVKAALVNAPGAAMVARSAGGDALYCVILGPVAETYQEYQANWLRIADGLPPDARAAVDKNSRNVNKLRFIASDPEVWLADMVTPLELEPMPAELAPIVPLTSFHDEPAIDCDALAYVTPPDSYADWLGWLPTLKSLRFTPDEVETWSSIGSKYREGEVRKRWGGLPVDQEVVARNKLRGYARNMGWPGPTPRLAGSNGKDDTPFGDRSAGTAKQTGGSSGAGTVTQLSIARVFAKEFEDMYGYDAKRETWYQWDGSRHWPADRVPHLIGDVVAGVVTTRGLPSSTERSLATAGALKSMAGLASAYMIHEWDAQRTLLGLPGGKVLDTTTLEVRAQQREDFITRALPDNIEGWDRVKRPSEIWEDFVQDRLLVGYQDTGDRLEVHDFLQQWGGSALTGDCRDETMLFLYGRSGTGKSTFAETLFEVFGSYGTVVAGRRVVSDRHEHLQWLARCQGERYVFISELPARGAWQVDTLADLISGGLLEANRMRQDSIHFRSQAHVIASGNNRPRAGSEQGIWRRLAMIECLAEPDPTVGNTLKLQLRAEVPGVFAWLYEGLKHWHGNKRVLKRPQVLQAATENYRRSADPFAAFAKEHLFLDSAVDAVVDEIYQVFVEWWGENQGSGKVPGKQALGRKLDMLGFPEAIPGGGGRGRERRGVRLIRRESE